MTNSPNSGYTGSYDPFGDDNSGAPYGANQQAGGSFNQVPGYQAQGQQGSVGASYAQGYGTPPPSVASTGMGWAIAALIMGIIALLTSLFVIGGFAGLIALILAVVALVKGSKARKLGLQTTGTTVMSVFAIVLAVLAIIGAFFMTAIFGSVFGAVEQCNQYQNDPELMQECIQDSINEKFGVN